MLRERQREAASGPTSHSSSGAAPPPPDRGTRRMPAPLLLDAHDGVETGMPQGAPNGTAGPADRDGDRFRRTGDRAEQGVGTRDLSPPEWFIIESRFWPLLSSVTVAAAPKATVICVDGDAVTNGEPSGAGR